MFTISANICNKLTINNSIFITELIKINSVEDTTIILTEIKKKHKKADHYCYGFIVDDFIKSSDDKEPTKTAGPPILNALTTNNLNHVICIVIRYFGGIKLGTGGLIRAYSKCTKEAIKLANLTEIKNNFICEINFDFNNKKLVDNILKDTHLIKKSFTNTIVYQFIIDNYLLDNVLLKLKLNNIKIKSITKI